MFVGKIALGFIDYYLTLICDHNPENGRLYLPLGITVNDIYVQYKGKHPDERVTEHTFYNIWRKNIAGKVSKQANVSNLF